MVLVDILLRGLDRIVFCANLVLLKFGMLPSGGVFIGRARSKMAHGGDKYRGGKSAEVRQQRNEAKDSKNHDSRKSHDTERRGSGGKSGR